MTKHTLNPILAYEPISPKSPEPLHNTIIAFSYQKRNYRIVYRSYCYRAEALDKE